MRSLSIVNGVTLFSIKLPHARCAWGGEHLYGHHEGKDLEKLEHEVALHTVTSTSAFKGSYKAIFLKGGDTYAININSWWCPQYDDWKAYSVGNAWEVNDRFLLNDELTWSIHNGWTKCDSSPVVENEDCIKSNDDSDDNRSSNSFSVFLKLLILNRYSLRVGIVSCSLAKEEKTREEGWV